MSALEIISLASLTLGAAALLRFVWLDSLRFADPSTEAVAPARVTRQTAERLALQDAAARVNAEVERLPRAA